MSPAERQAAIDAAAKLGHVIRRDKNQFVCACGHFMLGRDEKMKSMAIDIHVRNAVSFGRKIDAEPPMVAHPRDGD